MRQLEVRVPYDRCDDIITVLQEACRLKNVARVVQDGIAIITCFITPQDSGKALYELDKIGCGVAYGKIALIPVNVLKPLPKAHLSTQSARSVFRPNAWARSSRMAIEEIYTNVQEGAQLNFDYVLSIAVAGSIASTGLATNNAVMIVASMLLSPLMGPIMGFTFGTAVRDWDLVARSLVVEAVGIVVTFFVGSLGGFLAAGWSSVVTKNEWPTDEMQNRGTPAALIIGVFFAVPSGLGVGLCATAGGATGLVGVAIAASLLPPIVNAGMNMAFALCGAPAAVEDSSKFWEIGAYSLALFSINVVCIYITAMAVFALKKVTKVRREITMYRDLPPLPVGKNDDIEDVEKAACSAHLEKFSAAARRVLNER